jgi:hypothetical protein
MKVISECPDQCGRKIYEVENNYRGFQIKLVPWGGEGDWELRAEKIHEKDVLDQLILASMDMEALSVIIPDKPGLENITGKRELDDLVKSIHYNIDLFWKRKQHIIDLAKKDELKVFQK